MLYRSRGEKVFNVINIIIMTLIAGVTLYPFLNVLAISFNEGLDTVIDSSLIFPRKFTLQNFLMAIRYPNFIRAFWISVARTVLGVTISILTVTLAAYALSKKNLIFRNIIITFLIIPRFINPGLIPNYINMHNLGLINNFLVYVLPGAFSFYSCLIIRTYIQGLPAEMEESAVIDGASYWKVFIKIIFPMSMPCIAAITLFSAVGGWNDWMTSLIYVPTRYDLHTLQYLLQRILKESQTITEIMNINDLELYNEKHKFNTTTELSIRMAALVITVTPIIVVYPMLQKHFAKGLLLGAVKG